MNIASVIENLKDLKKDIDQCDTHYISSAIKLIQELEDKLDAAETKIAALEEPLQKTTIIPDGWFAVHDKEIRNRALEDAAQVLDEKSILYEKSILSSGDEDDCRAMRSTMWAIDTCATTIRKLKEQP